MDTIIVISFYILGAVAYFKMMYRLLGKKILDPTIINQLEGFTRIEVIDSTTPRNQTARVYVRYLKENEKMSISLQDDNRTIKIFIDEA